METIQVKVVIKARPWFRAVVWWWAILKVFFGIKPGWLFDKLADKGLYITADRKHG